MSNIKKKLSEKIETKNIFILVGLFSFIILSLNFVGAVTLNIGTKLTTTGNITINIENFTVYTDSVVLSNDSITFYNLTYLHPNACNNTFKPVFNYTQANVNSSTLDWTVTCSKSFYLSACNSTNNVTFINFTFSNSNNLTTNLNGTLNSATFSYYPNGFLSLAKTYNFTSSSINYSYPFCINPPDYTYYINYNTAYSSNGYSNGIKASEYKLYSNTSTNEVLYLINSSNVVTFQVINSFSQAIPNAYVYVLPYLNDTIISSGYTDSGGIIQFLLNNGTTYRVYFSKSGYDSYSITQSFDNTFYTITLSGLGVPVTVPPDYSSGSPSIPNSVGVTYSTKPKETWLNNGTYYNFNYTIDSGTWNLTNWGFNLTDQDSNLINTTSSTNATGGTLNINASTSNYTKVIMNFYYTINGNTTNLQRVWVVLDTSDNSYSIKHALDDATSYINSGLFGLTERGRAFIVFFLIFIGAGVLSYKFGMTSQASILGFIFVMVWFFNITMNWIPIPAIAGIQAVTFLPTILVGILLFGVIIREVTSG